MKKISPSILVICIFAAIQFLLSSCGLFSDPVVSINSRHIPDEETDGLTNSKIGTAWNKNRKPTNIDQNHVGYVVGVSIADPCVVKKKNEITGQWEYHIWFTGISKVDNKNYYTIRYASSADGITWTHDGISNIALAPTAESQDTNGVRVGSVIWDDERKEFHMWYRGLNGANNWKIFFARSKDPLRGWVKHPNSYTDPDSQHPKSILESGVGGFDSDKIDDLSVIKKSFADEYGTHHYYEMWYSAKGAKGGQNVNPLEKEESQLEMIKYRIMYAQSGDGLKWLKESLPVLEPMPGAFDFGGKRFPVILYDQFNVDMPYNMWYVGGAEISEEEGGEDFRVGLAQGFSGDSFRFYDPETYTEGLLEFPIHEVPENCTVAIKDPTVIKDKAIGGKNNYIYKMWYVVNFIEKTDNTNTIQSSQIHFIESWGE